jgi:hypothetical protein
MRSRVAHRLATILDKQPESRQFLRGVLTARADTEEAQEKLRIPLGFSGTDFVTFLLHVAAEVEHALLVEYLFAAYSLGGPQVPKEHRHRVQKWQTVILGIAKEEMGHFVTVQNVLRLIGAPLNLERDDFPWDMEYAPFAFTLEKLSAASLARYVYVEAPQEWPDDARPFQEEIEKLATGGQTQPVNRVGKLYDRLIAVLGDPDIIPDSAFQSSTLPFQASWDEWGRGYRDGARGAAAEGAKTPDLIIGTAYSRDTAMAALQAVMAQGEAPDLDSDLGERSHFRRFFAIWKEFPKEGEWSPVRDLAPNPTTVEGLTDTSWISGERPQYWGYLLNLRYRMLLTYLAHSFRLSGSDSAGPAAEARGLVLNSTFGEMYNLRVISNLMVALPLDGAAGPRAGPPFELPYTLDLPYGETDAWQVHIHLIDASLRLIGKLEKGADDEEKAYLATLRGMDVRKRASLADIVSGASERRARLGGWA